MESITLELRPRLRSLNAYISLLKSIDYSTIKVKLLENAIEIKLKEKTYNLPLPNIKLLPSSLSSLQVTNHWISFRIQTQPNWMYGSFETEIIDAENKLNNCFLNISQKIELPPKNTDCKLLCGCCKNEITKTVCFQRILPLPSSDCNPQEWFCCKHSNGEPFSLDPGERDLFYSINYLVLNKHVFKENLKLRNSLIHCNRCLSNLGSLNGKDLKSLKFWNCCIEYKICNDNSIIKEISSTLDDFLSAVKHVAEFIIGEKILLEAQDVNSIHYIMLRSMESKLNLFTADSVNPYDKVINLESSFVIKVLYKYGETNKTARYDDPDVKYCELALPSILAGINQLMSSTARFPPAYRRAEDFYISYLSV